jgi:hypothetical protein
MKPYGDGQAGTVALRQWPYMTAAGYVLTR